MARLLIDTTEIIRLSSGNQTLIHSFKRLAEEGHQMAVSVISVAEFYTESTRGERPEVDDLLASLDWWEVTPRDALWAGEHRATQRRKGYTISLWDALIAAAAVRHRAAILTSNLRDFRVAGIEVMRMEDYPP